MTLEQSGLTVEEQYVADALVVAWAAWKALPESILPDEFERFRRAIHDAQDILAYRIVRRLFPLYWV